jgi:adenosine deaminase
MYGTVDDNTMKSNNPKRAELHTHLGGAVDPAILWSIAHAQGIRLPSKDYWEFEDMITMTGDEYNQDLDEMHNKFYYWTELIQSSPLAVEESVKSVIGGGYRKCNLVLQELRFNPMFRNRSGEQDLDHIIMAALRGMDKAMLEYPQVKAGLILMMDRMLTPEQNEVILKKALFYKNRGIIGIDIAGPQRTDFSIQEYRDIFAQAREAGLGITIHTGEEGSIEEMRYVVKEIQPDRIGHGILCVNDPTLMHEIVEKNITLESCPTSNLRNQKVKNVDELKKIFQTYVQYKVPFTINTDGPEMYQTNVEKEENFLLQQNILDEQTITKSRMRAFEATFIKP